MTEKNGCECSLYDYVGGKVAYAQCVIDGLRERKWYELDGPCFYVLMPPKYWYDPKEHKILFWLRTIAWNLRHPFYAMRNRSKKL